MKLKSRNFRMELEGYLAELSDVNYQRRNWVENRTDSFRSAIHFFLDDTYLKERPEVHIGYFLLDETEARAVQKVALAIDYILEEEGTMSDAEFIALDDWKRVVTAAAEAKRVVAVISGDEDAFSD